MQQEIWGLCKALGLSPSLMHDGAYAVGRGGCNVAKSDRAIITLVPRLLGALYIGIADPHRPERMGTELSLLHCDGPGQHLSRPTPPGGCRADVSAPSQCACTRSTEGMPSASRRVTCYAWMRARPLRQHEAHVKPDMPPLNSYADPCTRSTEGMPRNLCNAAQI